MLTRTQLPQTLGQRVVAFFRENLDEELTEADIATKFSEPVRCVSVHLARHIAAGELVHERDTYRAGPTLLPPGYVAPAPRRAVPTVIGGVEVYIHTTQLRIALPPVPARGRVSPYRLLLESLQPGQWAELDMSHMRALQDNLARHYFPQIVVRKVTDTRCALLYITPESEVTQ